VLIIAGMSFQPRRLFPAQTLERARDSMLADKGGSFIAPERDAHLANWRNAHLPLRHPAKSTSFSSGAAAQRDHRANASLPTSHGRSDQCVSVWW